MHTTTTVIMVCTWTVVGVSATYSFPGDPEWEVRVITKEEIVAAKKEKVTVIQHVFGDKAELIRRFNRISSRFVRTGTTLRVPSLAEGEGYEPLPQSLSRDETDGKRVLIVLDRQFLAMYEDGMRIASFPVVSGKKDHYTPIGDFRVTRKDKDHVSSTYPEPDGGSPMPWAVRFRGSAYWIHGGDMPGRPSSHGCVRMFRKDAKIFFGWVERGTDVYIVASLSEE